MGSSSVSLRCRADVGGPWNYRQLPGCEPSLHLVKELSPAFYGGTDLEACWKSKATRRETQSEWQWACGAQLLVPVEVKENSLGNSRIPSGGNDGSPSQPWVTMMGQVGKVFVNRIGLTWHLIKGKNGMEGEKPRYSLCCTASVWKNTMMMSSAHDTVGGLGDYITKLDKFWYFSQELFTL